MYELDLAARGEPRPLLIHNFDQQASSQSADGRLIAYTEVIAETVFLEMPVKRQTDRREQPSTRAAMICARLLVLSLFIRVLYLNEQG